jgi:hypothetical protein
VTAANRLGLAVLAVAGLRLCADRLGAIPVALAAAAVGTVAAVTWWARVVEARHDAIPRTPRPPGTTAPPSATERHLAFARALAAVASRYLDECERENRR